MFLFILRYVSYNNKKDITIPVVSYSINGAKHWAEIFLYENKEMASFGDVIMSYPADKLGVVEELVIFSL